MVLMLRLFFILLLGIGLYWCFKYLLNPHRKLAAALEQKKILLMDDKSSVHRNLLLAYRGVLFEGEKYMGTVDHAFHIVKIFLWPRDNQKLVGLELADFRKMEDLLRQQYPHAEITWRSPIKELMQDK